VQSYADASQTTKEFVEHIEHRVTELDSVRFVDEADKAAQLAALDAEFNGTKMHKRFEALMESMCTKAFIAKELHGFEELSLTEPIDPVHREILDAVSNQTLQQAVLQQLNPLMMGSIRSIDRSQEWTPEGIRFKWAITLEAMGTANTLNIEHTLNMDARDLCVAKMRHSFARVDNNLRQRLSSLNDCATSSDLSTFSNPVVCDQDEMCVVCQDELANSEDAVELACGHRFHATCIEGWVLGCKPSCPICKAPLVPQEKPSTQNSPTSDTTPTPPARFAAGTTVQFHSLRARADLNGLTGEVMAWRSQQGRYSVRCSEGSNEVVAVRPDNLIEVVELTEPESEEDVEDQEYEGDLDFAIRMSLGEVSIEESEASTEESVEQTLCSLRDAVLTAVHSVSGIPRL